VTLDVNGTPIALTDPDGDRVFEGVITTPAAGTIVTSTLTVDCGSVTNAAPSQVLIDPVGTVYDVTTQAALGGAGVMCLQHAAPRNGDFCGRDA
jgi:hypothetical protein